MAHPMMVPKEDDMTRALRPVATALSLTAATLLAGCGGFSDALGLSRSSPDEFTVLTKEPLVVPPNVNLRPPSRGEAVPPEVRSVNRSREVVFGRGVKRDDNLSTGENVILARAGATEATKEIRDVVEGEQSNTPQARKEDGQVDDILFWRAPRRGDQ